MLQVHSIFCCIKKTKNFFFLFFFTVATWIHSSCDFKRFLFGASVFCMKIMGVLTHLWSWFPLADEQTSWESWQLGVPGCLTGLSVGSLQRFLHTHALGYHKWKAEEGMRKKTQDCGELGKLQHSFIIITKWGCTTFLCLYKYMWLINLLTFCRIQTPV